MTLVEVLVAVFILVFGMYAVVRVFPLGLTMVQSGQHRTMATRLAEQMMERLKAAPERVPEGIVCLQSNIPVTDEDGTPLGPTVNGNQIRPDWLKPVDVDPNGYEPNMRTVRDIQGEGLVIPPPAPGSTISVALNLFGPMDNAVTPTVWAPFFQVANPFYDLLDDGREHQQFYITCYPAGDGSKPWQKLGYLKLNPVPYTRNLRVTLLAYDGVFRMFLFHTYWLTVSANQESVQLAMSPNDRYIKEDSVKVSEQFTAAANPNQHATFSYDLDGGVLRFYGGDQGLFVRYSYRLRDWNILVEDDVLNVNAEMRTDVKFLNDENLPGMSTPVLGVTPEDGQLHTPSVVDYENGVVTFDIALANRPIRLFYRSLDNWAVLAQKAYADYTWYASVPAGGLPSNGYYVNLSPDTSAGWSANDTVLQFAPSEAGKTIEVCYEWDDDADPTTPNKVVTKTITISDAGAPYTATIEGGAGSQVQVTDIKWVRGVSLSVKAIWKDRRLERYVQLDTLLPGLKLAKAGE